MSSAVGKPHSPPPPFWPPLPHCLLRATFCSWLSVPLFLSLSLLPLWPCATRLQSNFIYLPFFGKVFLAEFCFARGCSPLVVVVVVVSHLCLLVFLLCLFVCVCWGSLSSPLQQRQGAGQGRSRPVVIQFVQQYFVHSIIFNACL